MQTKIQTSLHTTSSPINSQHGFLSILNVIAWLTLLMVFGFILVVLFTSHAIRKSQVAIQPSARGRQTVPAISPTYADILHQPDDSTSWSMYKNMDSGYSIDYPSNWIVEPVPTYSAGRPDLLIWSPDAKIEPRERLLLNGIKIVVAASDNQSDATFFSLPATATPISAIVPENLSGKTIAYYFMNTLEARTTMSNGKRLYIGCSFTRGADSTNKAQTACSQIVRKMLSSLHY